MNINFVTKIENYDLLFCMISNDGFLKIEAKKIHQMIHGQIIV